MPLTGQRPPLATATTPAPPLSARSARRSENWVRKSVVSVMSISAAWPRYGSARRPAPSARWEGRARLAWQGRWQAQEGQAHEVGDLPPFIVTVRRQIVAVTIILAIGDLPRRENLCRCRQRRSVIAERGTERRVIVMQEIGE